MVEDCQFYAAQAADAAGISKATLLRWIRNGRVADARRRDRNGWRVFDAHEVERLKHFADGEPDDVT